MTLLWVLLLGLLIIISCAAGQRATVNCGKYNPTGLDNKIGYVYGVARPGEFPWLTAVLDRRDGLTRYIGGGSLIAPNVVLTAQHILSGTVEEDLVVRAGEWNASSTDESYPHVDLGVEKVILHEQYNSFNGDNDVALLFLKTRFPVQNNIRTVCLPAPNTNFVGRRCFFNGWGRMEVQSEDYPSVPKKVDVLMKDKTVCNELRKQVPFNGICAESLNHRASCKGDGGSPLVCPMPMDPTRFEQAGIVAMATGCGSVSTLNVYTDVSKQRNWINYHLNRRVNRLGQ